MTEASTFGLAAHRSRESEAGSSTATNDIDGLLWGQAVIHAIDAFQRVRIGELIGAEELGVLDEITRRVLSGDINEWQRTLIQTVCGARTGEVPVDMAFEKPAVNELDGSRTLATPVVVKGRIDLRTGAALYWLREDRGSRGGATSGIRGIS